MAEPEPGQAPSCLRCGAALLALSGGSERTCFHECPACGRQYAQRSGAALTFRWGHPISLALYPVQMFPQPDGVEAAARDMRRNRPPAEVAAMADEIALELDQPTQQVRDILGCAASEESCRAFLAGVVRELRKAM